MVLITHIYALMHFRMLGNKARHFHKVLRDTFPGEGDNKEIRGNKRRLVPSNIFVQILAGPPELRGGLFGIMLKAIAFVTLVLFPVLVLLLLQIQFLPFHDTRITWAQRGALFFDVLLLWPLRPPILADLSAETSQRARLFSRALRGFGLAIAFVMSVAVVWFSIAVATVPGEWRRVPLSYVAKIEPKVLTDLAFGTVDARGIVTGNWPSDTLRLQGFDIYEALKVDDPKKLDWKDYIFDLQNRQLEHADFSYAKLGKVNLNGANLEGASLVSAQLQGASLFGAQLHSSLWGAQLQGASLGNAQLQGASLDLAQLQGASLFGAELHCASLGRANLRGASLDGARLQGATLDFALFPRTSALLLQRVPIEQVLFGSTVVDTTDLSCALLWRTNWEKN